jgi:hypothetical protein
MWKKFTALFLALAIAILPATAFAATAANMEIKVTYNKKAIVFPDQKPLMINKRTLVPIRPIAESLGFKVDWNKATRTVTITKEKITVSLVVSQKIAKRNGEIITLDVPAQIVNERTVVPVRFIAEALNYKVDWAQATQTVLIADKEIVQVEQPAEPANLIVKESIEASSFAIAGVVGSYRIKGKVAAGTKLSVQFDGQWFDVPVGADGSFEFKKSGDAEISTYKLKAVKDNREDTLEGKFQQ